MVLFAAKQKEQPDGPFWQTTPTCPFLPFNQEASVDKPFNLIHKEKVVFQIIAFAWRRPKSLARLFTSLLAADYFGKKVNLLLFLDGRPSPAVVEYVRHLEWPHGVFQVKQRRILFGLEKNIMESWYPESDNEYAIFLEDDIEVSKHYFRFLWDVFQAHFQEFTSGTSIEQRLAGISLYAPLENQLQNKNSNFDLVRRKPYDYLLQSQPCSWGALYFPAKWREFVSYYNIRIDETLSQSFPIRKSHSNNWNRSWKKYYIEFLHLSGFYFLFPNYTNHNSFSTNHNEIGVHVGGKRNISEAFVEMFQTKQEKMEVPLVQTYVPAIPSGLERLSSYPVLDLFFRKVSSLQSLFQMGHYAQELYSLKGAFPRQTISAKCLLDHLAPDMPVLPKSTVGYITTTFSGSLKDQLQRLLSLLAAGDNLQRRVLVAQKLKDCKTGEIFDLGPLFETFSNKLEDSKKSTGKSSQATRPIRLVNENQSINLDIFVENQIPVPIFFPAKSNCLHSLQGCQDQVLLISNISYLLPFSLQWFESQLPQRQQDLINRIQGKFGKKCFYSTKQDYSTDSEFEKEVKELWQKSIPVDIIFDRREKFQKRLNYLKNGEHKIGFYTKDILQEEIQKEFQKDTQKERDQTYFYCLLVLLVSCSPMG